MVDNIPTPAPAAPVVDPVVPVQTPTPAPVVAPAPVVDAPVVPVVESVPVVTPEPTPEPAKTETLLGEAPVEPVAPEPAKTEPTVEPEVKPNTDGGQTENAPPPSYDPFALPEGVSLDKDRVGKFTEILSELETGGKVPHELVQQFGQKAVDFHIAEVTKVMQDYNTALQDSWSKQKNDWKEAVIQDPELGGNRLQSTIDSANNFIRTHGGTTEQQNEFRALMEASGLGNHLTVIRFFANAGRTLAEGKPLGGVRPAPAPKSKTQTLYGKSL